MLYGVDRQNPAEKQGYIDLHGMHICGLNASAIESLWLRDTNAEIDGDFGGDTYSAMVPADEENYSDKNRTTNYPHLQDLEEKLNSSSCKVVRIAHINVCSLRTKMNKIRVYRDNANSKFLLSQRRT